MDTTTLIAYLKFLQEQVFTTENVAKAQELGKNLGDILAEVYEFAAAIGERVPAMGSRNLTLLADIEHADLTEQWGAIIDSVNRR